MKRVEDCMSPTVVTVDASATLDRAAQAMMERKVGSAVIVEAGRLVGIITERDILRAVARALVPWSTPVSECMTPEPQTVSPQTSAEEALSMMLSHRFRHLPVIGDKGVMGIVSLRDLAGSEQTPVSDK
jgi:CBS domain-containing protein